MVPAIGQLERGRESYATPAWLDAYESLSQRAVKDRALPPPRSRGLSLAVRAQHALGAAVAQLDEEVRAALQYEVVDAWQQFTDDGTLILQLGITTASARK